MRRTHCIDRNAADYANTYQCHAVSLPQGVSVKLPIERPFIRQSTLIQVRGLYRTQCVPQKHLEIHKSYRRRIRRLGTLGSLGKEVPQKIQGQMLLQKIPR